MNQTTVLRSRFTPAALLGVALALGACVGPKGQDPTPGLDVLQVLPQAAGLEVGESALLGALRLKDGTSNNINAEATWTSDNEAVATVTYDEDLGAVVTAVAPGTAHVFARTADAEGSSEVTVLAAVRALEIEAGVQLAAGTSYDLSSVIIAEDDTKRELGDVTWISSNEHVLSIDTAGHAVAVSPGTVTLYVTRRGVTYPGPTLTVSSAKLTQIVIDAARPTTVPSGRVNPFGATGIFDDGTEQDVSELVQYSLVYPDGVEKDSSTTVDEGLFSAGAPNLTLSVVGSGIEKTIAEGLTSAPVEMKTVAPELTAVTIQAPAVISSKAEPSSWRLSGSFGELRYPVTGTLGLKTNPDDPEDDGGEEFVYIDATLRRLEGKAAGEVTLQVELPVLADKDGDDDPKVTGEAALKIVDDDLSALTLEPAEDGTSVAAIAAFGAEVSQEVTSQALWSTDDPSVHVTNFFGASGLLSVPADFVGTVTVTAKYRSLTASTAITYPLPSPPAR